MDKRDEASENRETTVDELSAKVQVVPVPMEIYGELLEILQELPYKQVGRLLNKMAQLRAVEATVNKE